MKMFCIKWDINNGVLHYCEVVNYLVQSFQITCKVSKIFYSFSKCGLQCALQPCRQLKHPLPSDQPINEQLLVIRDLLHVATW